MQIEGTETGERGTEPFLSPREEPQGMDPELERRLEGLETKFAYQEEAVSKMSELVWNLSRRVDHLESLASEMRRRLVEMENPEPNPPADQRPPHY